MHRLEFTTPRDPFLDFCMWPYRPPSPYHAKLRSVNLLLHAFAFANAGERAFRIVQAVRDGIGPFRTVWGVKQSGGRIAWELYFYDYERREREISVAKLLSVLEPMVRCDLRINEKTNYFMFSIDVDADLFAGSRKIEEIHLYLGNPGSSVSSGICYSLTERGAHLENFYFFFDARRDHDDIRAKVACSAHLDSTVIGIERILWPELKGCRIIVVANKQRHDSVYFSGIDVAQLVFFLKKMAYPEPLVAFVEDNQSRLDHLLYDVGFDYRMEGRELIVSKSAYYGVF